MAEEATEHSNMHTSSPDAEERRFTQTAWATFWNKPISGACINHDVGRTLLNATYLVQDQRSTLDKSPYAKTSDVLWQDINRTQVGYTFRPRDTFEIKGRYVSVVMHRTNNKLYTIMGIGDTEELACRTALYKLQDTLEEDSMYKEFLSSIANRIVRYHWTDRQFVQFVEHHRTERGIKGEFELEMYDNGSPMHQSDDSSHGSMVDPTDEPSMSENSQQAPVFAGLNFDPLPDFSQADAGSPPQ